jgi:putative phosphoserine phosphatase/1-acylglycerol-3-phosphate O-acyltransferase
MSLAFFDVDGTLLPHPSLERRLVWRLLRGARIPAANCLRFLAAAAQGAPRGLHESAHANKAYLRGLDESVLAESGVELPCFFPAAIERVCWHALRGHAVVLVTGTPAPLAALVQGALERELVWRGVRTEVHALATELETLRGRWTGRVCGRPMFGEEKAAAIARFARDRAEDLGSASAYGNHVLDRWMLAAAGRPCAVNPSPALANLARLRGWPAVTWDRRPETTAARVATDERVG